MFKNENEFSLYIEQVKLDKGFESYTETITYLYENEFDHEMVDIAKMLNKKIIDTIQREAEERGLMKSTGIRLF